jgi:choline dehydrogenase-like flavoprotein
MNQNRYDAIVIGSGAGGVATAYRLVLGGLRVALLEKGAHLPLDGSTLDVQRVIHERAFLSREAWMDGHGRRFTPEEHFNVGGKTKWYGAALLRFAEHEFSPDPAHGCRGWPITLHELAPYYCEAERLLAVRTVECEAGLSRILRRLEVVDPGWKTRPMPIGLADTIAADPTEATHFDGFASVRQLKAEAESAILSKLNGKDSFKLLINAEATGLIGAEQNPNTIIGVRLANGQEILAGRVFLAAGALHSPRLLARYFERTGRHQELPAARHVGRLVKLHLLTAVVSISQGEKTDLIRKTVILTHGRFPHSSVQPLGFDAELVATLLPKFLPERVRQKIGRRAYGFFLQTEDGSDERNAVLDNPVPGACPMLDYDAARLPQASREHGALVAAFQWALVRSGMLPVARRISLEGTAHVCGSLVCGRDPAESVVDSHGCVHGMNGIYVVDGSILPRSSKVNPSLTIYAWGLRIGDLVSRQFQREQRLPNRDTVNAV